VVDTLVIELDVRAADDVVVPLIPPFVMQTQQQQPTGELVARSAMPQQLSHPSNALGFAASASL
jgi:hypothetical protein